MDIIQLNENSCQVILVGDGLFWINHSKTTGNYFLGQEDPEIANYNLSDYVTTEQEVV